MGVVWGLFVRVICNCKETPRGLDETCEAKIEINIIPILLIDLSHASVKCHS